MGDDLWVHDLHERSTRSGDQGGGTMHVLWLPATLSCGIGT